MILHAVRIGVWLTIYHCFCIELLFNFVIQQNSFNQDADPVEILVLEQLERVLYKWFTAIPSKGRPITGPVIIEKSVRLSQDENICQVHIL
jgi:hypothetical protein